MEQKFEQKEINITQDEPHILKTASESLLANLPILILGLVLGRMCTLPQPLSTAPPGPVSAAT